MTMNIYKSKVGLDEEVKSILAGNELECGMVFKLIKEMVGDNFNRSKILSLLSMNNPELIGISFEFFN